MKNISACLSHHSDNWKTPKKLYDYFISNGFLDLFPFECKYNQFEKIYEGEKLFINPPFSKLSEIPQYIFKLIKKNNLVWLLMPSRTDTIYFHELLKLKPLIIFIKGRLHFNDSKSAPFPTMLLRFCKIGLYLPIINRMWFSFSIDDFISIGKL